MKGIHRTIRNHCNRQRFGRANAVRQGRGMGTSGGGVGMLMGAVILVLENGRKLLGKAGDLVN